MSILFLHSNLILNCSYAPLTQNIDFFASSYVFNDLMVYFCARTSQLLLGAVCVLFLLRDGWALPVLFFFPDTVTPTGPTDGVPHPPLYVMIPIENLFDLLLHGWPLEYHPCVSRIAIGSTSVVSRPWR